MDWKDVGNIIGPLAPTLGGILGGVLLPGIGTGIGTKAGEVLATALGVDNTPDAVGKAITEDPDAVAKIQAAEQEASARWAAISQIATAAIQGNTAQASDMQMTIRAEIGAGQKWYAWRNLYGYSITVEVSGVFMLFFVSILFMPEVFARLMSASTWLTGWFTLRFTLLGYIHNQATTEKVAAATGQAPEGIVQSIVKAVKKS